MPAAPGCKAHALLRTVLQLEQNRHHHQQQRGQLGSGQRLSIDSQAL
jgi:hypothetical protein